MAHPVLSGETFDFFLEVHGKGSWTYVKAVLIHTTYCMSCKFSIGVTLLGVFEDRGVFLHLFPSVFVTAHWEIREILYRACNSLCNRLYENLQMLNQEFFR